VVPLLSTDSGSIGLDVEVRMRSQRSVYSYSALLTVDEPSTHSVQLTVNKELTVDDSLYSLTVDAITLSTHSLLMNPLLTLYNSLSMTLFLLYQVLTPDNLLLTQ
jgi:hypothetical protein